MDGQPESLLVATVDDRLVGYLTGCLDSAAMPSEGERITRLVIEHRLMFRREFVRFSARSMLDMLRAGRGRTASEFKDPRWPAHLHVRLVPEARGLGLGTALMVRWLDMLRDAGSAGCHLQTLLENSAAIAFFERLGFSTHGEALPVPGFRSFPHPRPAGILPVATRSESDALWFIEAESSSPCRRCPQLSGHPLAPTARATEAVVPWGSWCAARSVRSPEAQEQCCWHGSVSGFRCGGAAAGWSCYRRSVARCHPRGGGFRSRSRLAGSWCC